MGDGWISVLCVNVCNLEILISNFLGGRKMKIVKKDEALRVDNIVTCIFGSPGGGKTSLASTAKNPLLLDFDRGAYRSEFRPNSVQIGGWSDIENITKEELSMYDTIIVDTAGKALDFLTISIIDDNGKLATKGGALSQQGYGVLKGIFKIWLDKIRTYGKDIILLAHDKEDKKKDEIIQRPDIVGGSLGEVIRNSDIVAYLTIENGKRVLDFTPTEYHIGKDAGRLGMLPVPNFHQKADFMAELIQKAKDNLNSVSQEGQAIATAVSNYRDAIERLQNASDANEFVGRIKNIERDPAILAQVRGLMAKRATVLELKSDGKTYVEKEKPQMQLSIAQQELAKLPQDLISQAMAELENEGLLDNLTDKECVEVSNKASDIADRENNILF